MKARIWFIIMAVLLCAIATDNLFACSQTVSGADTSCNNANNDCLGVHGCTGTAFTASCTGNYDIDAWVSCPAGTSCYHCACCVFVQENGATIGTICSTRGPNDCSNSASWTCKKTCSSGVSLIAGHDYVLYVCLTYCPQTDSNCDNCRSSGCKALGCVRYAVTAPCY